MNNSMHAVSFPPDPASHRRFLDAVPGPPQLPAAPIVTKVHGRDCFLHPTVTPHEEHGSGWDVRLELEGGEGRTWRTGEMLRGKVEVKPREGVEQQKITSLIVRCYWQSTVLYTTFSTATGANSPSPTGVHYTEQAEFHRGYAPTNGEGLELPLDSTSDPFSSRSFDFAFTLPTITHSAFSNPSWCPPKDRSALMKLERCAPPSFDTGSLHDGTVDWIVEVLLRTEKPDGGRAFAHVVSEELPAFDPAPAASGELSSRGLLHSTPTVLIKRITFPFAPHDRFVEDYHRAWNDPAAVPYPSLGRDPRDELTTSHAVDLEEIAPGRLIEREGGKERWMTYFKEMTMRSGPLGMGKKATTLRAEISFPNPLRVSLSVPSLPFVLHLRHFHPTSKPSRPFLSRSLSSSTSVSPSAENGTSTPRLVKVDTLTLVLTQRILKRGGSAVRPTMSLVEVAKEEYRLGELPPEVVGAGAVKGGGVGVLSRESTATDGSGGSGGKSGKKEKKRPSLRLRAAPSTPAPSSTSLSSLAALDASLPPSSIDVPLSFPLPPPSSSSSSSSSAPLGLTFRLPNLEREYILVATLTLAGQTPGQGAVVARVPVQVVVGDADEEEAEGEGAEAREMEAAGEEAREVQVAASAERDPQNEGKREKLPLYEP
ncbi:hypothetical protein JCM6882_008986 [Rhodosporidiobolus microsporus]